MLGLIVEIIGWVALLCLPVAVIVPLVMQFSRKRRRQWGLVESLCWFGQFMLLFAILAVVAGALRATPIGG
ncbi:MAG: hypothetical protein AAGE65_04915 [Planctomycetota bacterium]